MNSCFLLVLLAAAAGRRARAWPPLPRASPRAGQAGRAGRGRWPSSCSWSSLWFAYSVPRRAAGTRFQFPSRPSTGSRPSGRRFTFGVDGIALVMLALIAVLVPVRDPGLLGGDAARAAAPSPGYFALLLASRRTMIGVFAATDVFLFYVFFEVMLVPMYFLIGRFGGAAPAVRGGEVLPLLAGRRPDHAGRGDRAVRGRRAAAGRGHLRLGRPASMAASDRRSPRRSGCSSASSSRSRSRRRSSRSTPGCPTPVPRRRSGRRALLVGVLDKVGTFGFLRYCLPLFPEASQRLAPLVLVLAVIGIIYGALLAVGQNDLKRFVAYTSIAHFGFIALGIFAFTTQAGRRRGALHGQPRPRHRPAVPGGRHARRPRRLAADRRLRRRRQAGAAAGGRVPASPGWPRWRCPAPNSFVSEFLVLIGTFTATSRCARSSPPSASSWPPLYVLWISSAPCRARCAATPCSARSSRAAVPAR